MYACRASCPPHLAGQDGVLPRRIGNSETTLLEFKTIPLVELEEVIKASKLTTCILDPLPSKFLEKRLPTLGPAILSIMNLSLSTGIVPSSFKAVVIKPLLKNRDSKTATQKPWP